jgi:endoglycosylceramidase
MPLTLTSMIRLIVLAAATAILSACWQTPQTPRYITDAQGRALILHGINTSSSAKSAPDHMPWIEERHVEQVTREFGMNFVRLLIFWDGIEPQRGVYDDAYLEAVRTRVRWFTSRGAYVMLDMHQDIYSEKVGGNGAPDWATVTSGMEYLSVNFPGMPWWVKNIDPAVIAAFVNFWRHDEHAYLQDHYIQAWVHVARAFRDEPGVIGYDLMNEPHAGDLIRAARFTFEPTWLKGLYDRLIPALRAVDQEKWLFFEPQSLAVNFGLPSRLPVIHDARSGDKRLVYAPHLYPFTLHEGVAYNLTDRLNMRGWNRHRARELDRQQVPLLVGEFGGSDTTPGFLQYLDDATAMFDQMGAGWAWWSDDPGSWGLLDGNGQENPKVNRLVRAYPQAIAGAPKQFRYDPNARHFLLEFSPAAGVSGPTEIFVPTRHYRGGFRVLTSDRRGTPRLDWDAARQVLSYWPAEPEASHRIEIIPAEQGEGGRVLGG